MAKEPTPFPVPTVRARVTRTIALPVDIATALAHRAAREGLTVSALIIGIVSRAVHPAR